MLNDINKRKIGLIIPSINMRMEPELYRCPELKDFNIYTTRIKLKEVTEESLRQMDTEITHAAEMLRDVNPEVVIFGCTSGSFLNEKDGEPGIAEVIESICKCPVVTASDALLEVLAVRNIKKLVLVTPYTDEINEKEKRFIEQSGVNVVAMKGLGITEPERLRTRTVEEVEALVRETDVPEADGVFISCTNLEGFHICGGLEKEMGKPVFSSNLACLWSALGKLGVERDVSGRVHESSDCKF